MEQQLEHSHEEPEHSHADGSLHTHTLPDGTSYTHSHADGGHAHGHTHSHTQTEAVLRRLSRAIGHLEAVKKMVENGRDCSEVLVQLAAVRAAITSTSRVIMKDHLEHCIADAVESGDREMIAELEKAIDQLLI